MDYVLKIFNDTNIQNSANYNILPLANIIKKDGKVVIDDSYIPPVLNIKANKKIDTIVSDLYSYLLSYVSQFESYKTSVELQNGLMTVSKQILALNTMAEYTAILDSYIYLDSPHPFEVYNTFAKMISRLSIFSTRVNVMGMTPSGEKLFKRYEHDNLEVSFNSASKLIKQLLDDITVGPEEVIAFKKDADYYHLDIPSQYFKSDKYDFYISVYSTKVEDLEEQIEFAKISSYDDIDNIVERSLSGLTFDIKDTAPIGMQKENDKFYVELDTSNQIWQTIKAKQNIAIYLDEEDSMKLELIIMSKQ
jgi:type VI secretion system protein ImpJ